MNTPVDFSGAHWRKSTRSSASGSDCVEIAALAEVVALRDSKNPEGAMLLLGRPAWREVARAVAKGELDL